MKSPNVSSLPSASTAEGLRILFDELAQVALLCDARGQVLQLNQRGAAFLESPAQPQEQVRLADLIGCNELCEETIARRLKGNRTCSFPCEIRTKSGAAARAFVHINDLDCGIWLVRVLEIDAMEPLLHFNVSSPNIVAESARVYRPAGEIASAELGTDDRSVSSQGVERRNSPASDDAVDSPDRSMPVVTAAGRWRIVRPASRVGVGAGSAAAALESSQVEHQIPSRAQQLELVESRFAHAQKIESIARLAGAVAHDFNNILVVILNYVEVLRWQINNPEFIGYLDEIKGAAQRAAALVKQLLAYARAQPGQPVVLDISRSLRDLQPILVSLIGRGSRVEISLPGEPLVIRIDPIQFDQIITNLVVNARDAIADNGLISIEAIREKSTELAQVGSNAESFIKVSVRDNGAGMDRESLKHLFEPFFSTKQTGTATGLGLATIYGTVTQLGGFVTVESGLGQGTTFDVYLPAVAESPDDTGNREGSLTKCQGGPTP